MTDPFTISEDLVRSRKRIQILKILRDQGELTRGELQDALECVRTTVNRNLEALQEYGWVEQTRAGYTITTAGKFVYDETSSMVETVEDTEYLDPILKHVSRDHLDIDISALRDAEITGPKPHNPVAMVDKHTDIIKQSNTQRAILPICSRHPAEIVSSRAKAGELCGELIVSPRAIDTIEADPDFTHLMREILDCEFEMYIYEDEIPFYLGLYDSLIHIGVDERGTPKALLESESSEVRAWAEEKYAKYKADAIPISEWPPANLV